MAVFKCKCCGAQLDVDDTTKVCECEYCGSKQTIPSVDDEKIVTWFNRANTLRIKAEFDKAEELYEKIVREAPEESESYWGMILCRFGIEYVEDPATGDRIPTCHRASYESVLSDEDYKNALKFADTTQKTIYEAQAKEIDRVQQGILAVSNNEDPYDVFICYKETDDDGNRTQDSVVANDIYYQLVGEGFKVFYAAITLEDKLGTEYEPYIFSALNSSKVMLVLGTKPEYYNAVWVKNEWSRFLKLMKKDRSRLLIPCYRDMDAYDLPEEFSHLQAQDMSKIGFINDLIRGIKKVAGNDSEKSQNHGKESSSDSQPVDNVSVDSLINRMYLALDDGQWKKADDLSDRVLDLDPNNSQAFIGKLLSSRNLNRKQDLGEQNVPFADDKYFKLAYEHADRKTKNELDGYINAQKKRIDEMLLKKREDLQKKYDKTYFDYFNGEEVDKNSVIQSIQDSLNKKMATKEELVEKTIKILSVERIGYICITIVAIIGLIMTISNFIKGKFGDGVGIFLIFAFIVIVAGVAWGACMGYKCHDYDYRNLEDEIAEGNKKITIIQRIPDKSEYVNRGLEKYKDWLLNNQDDDFKEEKDVFDVEITDVDKMDWETKRAFMDITGLGPYEADRLLSSGLPMVIQEGVLREEAEVIKGKLEKKGIRVSLK